MCRKLIYPVSFVSVLGVVGSASAEPTTGWSSRDIVQLEAAGSVYYNNITGTWVVAGNGLDIRRKK